MSDYITYLRKLSALNIYQELDAGKLYVDNMLRRAENYFSQTPKIFTTTMVPSEILIAFNVATLDSEEVAPIIASMRGDESEECIQAATKLGFSKDICNYPLITIGSFEQQLIPVPDAFVGSSYMCNDQYEMMKFLSYRHNKPLYIIDIPYWHDSSANEYVEQQIYELIIFLKDILNKPFDNDYFKQILSCSNSTYLLTEAIKFKRCQGLDIPGSEFIYYYGTQVLCGDMNNYAVIKTLDDECSQRSSPQKQMKAFWINVLPFRKKSLIRNLEKKCDLNIVYDELSTCNTGPVDITDPIKSLARKLLGGIYLNGIERRIKTIRRITKEYQINAAIGFSYSRCKMTSSGMSQIKQTLQQDGVICLEWRIHSISGDELPNKQIKYDFENLFHII